MSNTIRRRKAKWKFQEVVGSFAEWVGPSPGYLHHNSWVQERSLRTGVSLERMYQQRVAEYYGDMHSGRRAAPSWFRRLHGGKHVRLRNAHLLHVCDKYDEWDQHSAYPYVSNAGWFWF